MNTVDKPLVSVIVPVYNVERYLDACLSSIKQQTYQKLEIILVEDCSTDSSSDVLQRYLQDERIQLIQHDKNRGLSAARNTGMKAATGTYMMFVDSDDMIDSSLVQACVQGALASGADVVLFTAKPFEEGTPVQRLPEPKPENKLDRYQPISQADYFRYPHFAWLKFMRTELVRSKGLQFPIGHYYEDWPFHWDIGFVASNVVEISAGYYHYRQRRDSITGSGDQKLLHIFLSHRLVASITDQHSASLDARSIFAHKIYRGTWFVLTTIDSRYLKEAVLQAKEHLDVMAKYLDYGTPSPKIRMLLLSLKLPTPFSVLAITSMRAGLQQVSSARRYT